jgi:cell fate (sporulation/competence/biofilm development) regulator YmcA (YheA/YmcA/DUF963 family)
MKKNNVKFLLVATFGLFLFQSNVYAQNLKSLINKVTENESVKKAADAIKENETVKTTVEAVKASVIESVNAKIEDMKNPKAAEVAQKAPAQALAPDVKNTISDVRAFTGLTKEEFDAKVKALGFATGVDDATLGTTVYSSKTAGYSLSIKMGVRNSVNYVREVTKTTVTKKANLATVKTNFLKLGKQTEDLKALLTSASVKAKSAKGTNVEVLTAADKTSKFTPAFTKFSTKKEDGIVADAYSETDYTYDLNLTQTTVKAVSTAVIAIKVTDLTATAQ